MLITITEADPICHHLPSLKHTPDIMGFNNYPLHGYGCAGAVDKNNKQWDKYCYGVPGSKRDYSWFEKCCRWDVIEKKCVPKIGNKS